MMRSAAECMKNSRFTHSLIALVLRSTMGDWLTTNPVMAINLAPGCNGNNPSFPHICLLSSTPESLVANAEHEASSPTSLVSLN